MRIENDGARFTGQGLQCTICGSINNFEVVGFCDGTNNYGKVMKCCGCGNRVVQMYVYEPENKYRWSYRNIPTCNGD